MSTMKLLFLVSCLFLSLASAFEHSWHPAGVTDLRGPCPMMNTLANHGFIPRDGRNLTKEVVVAGLSSGLNFDASLAAGMWEQGVIVNPIPNATFFTLGQLSRHNILEHDASLSRMDAFFGNNHVFDAEVFADSARFWRHEVLSAEMLASSKLARMIESRAFNPHYTFTATTDFFSLAETAFPIVVFGDTAAGTVRRDLVMYFFEHERLPVELGWSKKNETTTLQTVLDAAKLIQNATNLLTPLPSNHSSDASSNRVDRGGVGFGRGVHIPFDL